MKKLLLITALILTSCSKEEYYEEVNMITPDNLIIAEMVGIKAESNFIQHEGLMNVKLGKKGDYFIKIYDINNKVVSKEQVRGIEGDNIFKVYTKTLPKSSYRLELQYFNETVAHTQINIID